jgi:hypothetical protein
MKTCSKCKVEKPLEDFYRSKQTKDGLHNWCKECFGESVRKYREENKDLIRARNLKYKSQDCVKEKDRESKRRYILNHPDRVKQSRAIWRDNSKDKRKAHHKVRKAIKDGFIIRPSGCEYCGKPTYTEAHHINYERPLDILWLCKECHEVEEVLIDYYKRKVCNNVERQGL